MDEFIKAFSNLSNDLLPILGAICLVCVILLLIKIIKLLSSVDNTILKTHNTIDLIDDSIEKVQAPLNTVVKLSHSVDKAYDTTAQVVSAAKDFVIDSAKEIKNKVTK